MGAFEDLVQRELAVAYARRALCPDDGGPWILRDDRLWCPFCGRYYEDDDA